MEVDQPVCERPLRRVVGGPGIRHLARTRHGSVAARNGMGGERSVQEALKCADWQSEGIAPSKRTRHRLLSLTQERMAHTAQLHSRGIGNVVPGVSNVWHCQPSSPRKRQSNSSRDATQATNSRPHARRDWCVCAPIPAGMRPGDKSDVVRAFRLGRPGSARTVVGESGESMHGRHVQWEWGGKESGSETG